MAWHLGGRLDHLAGQGRLAGRADLLRGLPGRQHGHVRLELQPSRRRDHRQYYNFLRLGREGYTRVQQACSDTAQWLASEIARIEPLELVYDGNGGLPAVCYKLKDGIEHGFTLYDLSERVRMRGWQIASYPLPSDRQDIVVQRVLVRHGVSRDLIAMLLDDLHKASLPAEKPGPAFRGRAYVQPWRALGRRPQTNL
ncbi:pyridoxal-dependent decarboxylase [Pseudomonas sp. PCH446]